MSVNDVYTKLRTAPNYHPASVDLFDDCTLQAGDVVTVRSGNDSYALPIFSQHLVWNGASTTQLESTGNEKRSDLPPLRKRDMNTAYGLGSGAYGTQKSNEEKFKQYETHFEQTDMYFSLLATESQWDELAQEGHVTAYTQILQTAGDVSIVAAKTGIEGLEEGETLYSKINVNAEAISTEVARAQGEETSLSSRITQTAESISTEVTNRTNADSALSSRITQTATDISTLVTKTGVNSLGQDETLYSKINQNAESISTEVTNRTNADSALSSRITQNANSISLVVSNGSIDAASIVAAVNSAGSSVKITASHIILDGDTVAASLYSKSLDCGDFTCDDLTAGGTANIYGNAIVDGYLIASTVNASEVYVAPGNTAVSSAIASFGAATSSGGQITIPTTRLNGNAGPSINFNIAATQYYIDGVAAAETTGWNAARAKVEAPAQGTGTSFTVKVPSATQNAQDTYTFSITKGATPGSSGYAAVSRLGVVVGRIAIGDWYDAGKDAMGVASSWNDNVLTFRAAQSSTKSDSVTITAGVSCVYNSTTHQYTVTGSAIADGEYIKTTSTGSGTAAYDAGEASVTLGTPSWDSVVTNSNNTYTVTASNGESKSQGLYLYAGGWASGARYVYMRTGSAYGTTRARIQVEMPASGTWSWSNPSQGYAQASITIGGKTYTDSHQIPSSWM
ncbi:MAG: hypothetical protein IJ523_07790 [Succinivibrionaceae bacterium]|nr:hypothetical protein [Succinivibrionaceae bacterium]